MTRGYVYASALAAFIAATIMTMFAIFRESWISWNVSTPTGQVSKNLGLHFSCSTFDNVKTCVYFPEESDCVTGDRYFCSMWRSVGFVMSFTAVLQCATTIAYVIIIAGGKQRREAGWKLMAFLLLLVATLQFVCMSIVAYLFDNDDRFFAGWALDSGWTLCTVSWCIVLISAVAISLSAILLPREAGYELIPSERTGI